MQHIPVYQPDLSGNEKKYVLECLDSTWISSKGRFIGDFEGGFASYVDAPHAVSVCNGTVALHLALVALGIGPGDEVIVPSLTYIASVNAIHYVGATPVFAESLADTWQVDPEDVERRIGPRTRAVMAVHLYGGSCEMDRLVALCEQYGLKLVEDCAEAIGTRIGDRHVGTFGDVATFSFFGNKTITTGEGGMVTCKDPVLDASLRHLRGQGLAANREYWHDRTGATRARRRNPERQDRIGGALPDRTGRYACGVPSDAPRGSSIALDGYCAHTGGGGPRSAACGARGRRRRNPPRVPSCPHHADVPRWDDDAAGRGGHRRARHQSAKLAWIGRRKHAQNRADDRGAQMEVSSWPSGPIAVMRYHIATLYGTSHG
jgi:hypothetical protein